MRAWRRYAGPLLGVAIALGVQTAGAQQMMRRAVTVPVAKPDPPPTPPPADPAGTPPVGTPPAGTPPPGTPPAETPPAPAQRDIGAGVARGPIQSRPTVQTGGMALLTSMVGWERLPGCGRRISIAAATQIYVTGCTDAEDKPIFHWKQDHWEPMNLAGTTVVAMSKQPFGDPDDKLPPYSGAIAISAAQARSGLQEESIGGGWVWAIGPPSGEHWGGPVMRVTCYAYLPNDCPMQRFGGDVYMKRIAAGLTDAVAWAIGEDGRIYRQVNKGDGWLDRPGCATAIANGGKERVWVIGCDDPDADGNRGIYRWDGTTFKRVPGAAKEIAVGVDGVPWVLTGDGGIWRKR